MQDFTYINAVLLFFMTGWLRVTIMCCRCLAGSSIIWLVPRYVNWSKIWMSAQLNFLTTMLSSCHLRKMARDPFFWCWERGTSKIIWNATFVRQGHVYCMSFHTKHRHVHKCTLTTQRLPGSAHGSMLYGELNTANRRMTQCLSPIALCQQHAQLVCTWRLNIHTFSPENDVSESCIWHSNLFFFLYFQCKSHHEKQTLTSAS